MPVTGWDALLGPLAETPRENGTPSLHQAAAFLRETLEATGLDVELVAFTAHPYALRIAGVLILVGTVLYAQGIRAERYVAALAVAILLPALLLLQLDFQVPVFAWIGAQEQHHVVAHVPVERPEQRLILAAHYDTKTDVLDHVERVPVEMLALPVIPLLLAGALAGAVAGRRLRWLGWIAATAGLLYGFGAFLALSAGAFVPTRSPGALDDGASCAVLVRLAEQLASEEAPLARTKLEIALLSAEEVGVQGSWVWAARRFASLPELPTWVVNLEGLGGSTRHAVLGRESFATRSFPASARLVQRLDPLHRERFGTPLEVAPFPGATDARSFLAHGIPAVTFLSYERGTLFIRGLHSADDSRDRIDEAALEGSLALLLDFVRDADARPL